MDKTVNPSVLNSQTCPEAWSFLYRLCKDGERKGVPDNILQSWRSAGPARNRLLHDFVSKCYRKDVDAATNRASLEAFVKLRQASREWKKNLVGFEWLTEAEMEERKWSENFSVELAHFVFKAPQGPGQRSNTPSHHFPVAGIHF